MFSVRAKNVPVAFDFDLFRSSFRVEQTNGILFPAMRVCRFRLQPFFAVFRKWHDEPEIGLIFSSGIQVWKQKRDVHEVEWFTTRSVLKGGRCELCQPRKLVCRHVVSLLQFVRGLFEGWHAMTLP
jgi:hypothetical protein